MMLRTSHAMLSLAGALSLALLLAAPVAGTEGGGTKPKPKPGAFAAGIDQMFPKIVQRYRQPIMQHNNPFKLELTREQLPKDASGLSEVMVQVYDAEAGKWKGYGLMELKRERLPGGGTRIGGATLDFNAPMDGIYCLRTLARDQAGNIEKKSGELEESDVAWVVVLDRAAPKVKILSPATSNQRLRPGSRLVIRWKITEDYPTREVQLKDPRTGSAKTIKSNRVEVSHDGGHSWKLVKQCSDPERVTWTVKGPDTTSLKIRVTVYDAAGNVGSATTSMGLQVTGFRHKIGKAVLMPSAARRTYQRGVIYMTRGDYPRAIRQFEEARRLDKKLLRVYVDLSATRLRAYEQEVRRTGDRNAGARHLQEGRVLCEAALKIPGFDREVSLHYNLALFLARGGDLTGAIKRLRIGLGRKPRHIESLYFKAYLHMKQRDAATLAKRHGEAAKLLATAKNLWKQVAALGGSKHPQAKQAIQCLRIVEGWEKRSASKNRPAPVSQPRG
jgi:tetratricopeptide (TPR) repeat protein